VQEKSRKTEVENIFCREGCSVIFGHREAEAGALKIPSNKGQRPIHGAGDPADSGEFCFKLSTLGIGIGLSASEVVETTTTAEQ
jgi:hypothetical protein